MNDEREGAQAECRVEQSPLFSEAGTGEAWTRREDRGTERSD